MQSNLLSGLLNNASTSMKVVQTNAKKKEELAKKELETLSNVAKTTTAIAKANTPQIVGGFGDKSNPQSLLELHKTTTGFQPLEFDNLMGVKQSGIPNLGFTQMGTQPVNMNVQPSPIYSIKRDAQMVRDDAIGRQNTTDDKVLKLMNQYTLSRQDLFDLGAFKRKELEQQGEDTTGVDDVDLAEFALLETPEEEKKGFTRSGIIGSLQGAFQEGVERQAQAQGRFDTGQQSGMETVSQQASATPGVISNLLGDVTAPIISTAGELGQKAGASLGNVLRPLFGKEMLNEEEKAQRITELNQWVAEQGNNAIVPLMKEYAKLDTRTQKNLESLLPYIDLGVGVGGTPAIGEQVAKTGIQEGLETGLQKGIKAVGDIKAPSIDLSNIGDSLRKSSIESVNKALNPTTKKMKQITQKIAPEVAQRGIYGDLETIGAKAVAGMEDFGAKIGEYIDTNGIKGSIKTNKLTEVFDNINKDFNPGGKIVNPQIQNITDGFKNILKQYGNDIDGENAKALMKAWDNVVYSTKGGIQTEDLALSNQFRKKGADLLRNELAKANPDLAKLNKEYSFWSNLKEVVDATTTRKTGQIGGLEKLATVIGGAGGLASGGIINAIGGAAAMKYLIGFAKSPLWNSMSASWKMKIANMISKGDNSVGKEIIKIAREKKVLPVSDDVMSRALVLSKEGPLESRGYTQRLTSPQKDITEINLPSDKAKNGYSLSSMSNSNNKLSPKVNGLSNLKDQGDIPKLPPKELPAKQKVADTPLSNLKNPKKSVQSDTLFSKADEMEADRLANAQYIKEDTISNIQSIAKKNPETIRRLLQKDGLPDNKIQSFIDDASNGKISERQAKNVSDALGSKSDTMKTPYSNSFDAYKAIGDDARATKAFERAQLPTSEIKSKYKSGILTKQDVQDIIYAKQQDAQSQYIYERSIKRTIDRGGRNENDIILSLKNMITDDIKPKNILAPKSGIPVIQKDLQPLYEEAKKYKSAEDMVKNNIYYRGETGGGGNYYSTDFDFARDFTPSGLDSEVKKAHIVPNDILIEKELPSANNEKEISSIINKAKKLGKKAIMVSEGKGQPNSIFVFDKSSIKTESQLRKIREEANKKSTGLSNLKNK